MRATARDLAARRQDGMVRLTGTVATPQDGWTVSVESDNPGDAGSLDKDVQVMITAMAPQAGPDVLTEVPSALRQTKQLLAG